MTNITVEFTYDLPDDQYHTTTDLALTGRLTYSGPAVQYAQVNRSNNKLTGYTIDAPEFEDYNNEDDGFYAVAVDCSVDPTLCAIFEPTMVSGFTQLAENIPGDSTDYVRDEPPAPSHTYKKREIEYNPTSGVFVTPYPWIGADEMDSWSGLISYRNNQLSTTDLRLSDDLPQSLYDNIAAHRQYLRDFPSTFGAAWDVNVTTAGTGYVVGERILISDSVFKNNTVVNDIVIKIETVSAAGAILTTSRQSKVHAYAYHPDAATYNDVFYTSNTAAGSGAVIQLSKVKLVDPWKITIKDIITDSNG
mgnify:FL=1|tara:strand:- start:3296 stop:4210 length:915 start_codon:yes stop_codon:yes gene_type:complete